MNYTEEKLAGLPSKNGFRLRGEAMTRIEVFSDAAFAFAVTMLVISLSAIPKNYVEFMDAIKGVPTFILSFSTIMGFWLAHRQWSRRFGLEDSISTFLTLGIIVVILIYVYPLKLLMSYTCHFASGGRLPTEFSITSPAEMTGLVITLGAGVLFLAIAFLGLYLRALSVSVKLRLNPLEQLRTRAQIAIWGVISGTALLSVLLAWLLHPNIGYRGGHVMLLPLVLIPIVNFRFRKLERTLEPKADSKRD